MNVLDTAVARLAARGARLGEARLVEREVQWIKVRDGRLDLHTRTIDRGLGVRALTSGWGYAASLDASSASALADRAVALADASAPGAYETIDVGKHPPARGEWRAPVKIDPFSVPLDEKVGLLIAATEAMGEGVTRDASIVCMRIRTQLKSTEGADVQQEQVITGISIRAMASKDGRVQVRSFPKSEEGDVAGRGWEHVLACDVVAHAPRVAAEARQLLDAPKIPSGTHDILLDGAQLSLQIHESCGHPIEGDRVLGEEMSLAGGSFLQPSMRGQRYGSPIVNLYAESHTEGAPGSFGWDDEGTPASRTDIVKDGVFVGWLTGREAANRLGTPNAAAMRADTWSSVPIVRMINVNLAPGQGTLDDLIRSTERGYLMSRNRSWSIDQLRLNFQFGCEAAYEIKDGEIVGLRRDPVYTGKTPRFWQSCDAIAGPEAWKVWGWAFCGKGDPLQIMHVGHGCAPARFRGVTVL